MRTYRALIAAWTVIEDATEKFNFFGTRPVIGAVINEEYRRALIT
jgi:hypothetical protein